MAAGPCLPGCGRHGTCATQLGPGLATVARCSCAAGWRGPLCGDSDTATSDYTQLTARLVLVLTNLSLVPATMLSLYRSVEQLEVSLTQYSQYSRIHRRHYTECLVYWLQLVAASLHQACAGPGGAGACLGHASTLRYSDTLASLLAVWVTVLAMAHLPPSLRSANHQPLDIYIYNHIYTYIYTHIYTHRVSQTQK